MGKRITIERNIKQDVDTKKFYVTLYYKSEGAEKVRETKTAETLKEARSLRDLHEAAVKLNLKDKQDKHLTLGKLIETYIESTPLEETTKYSYKNIQRHLSKHYIYSKAINDIVRSDVLNYISSKQKEGKIADCTINKHLDLLRAVFRTAYQDEICRENLMLKISNLPISNKFKGSYYTREECLELFEKIHLCDDYRLIVAADLAIFNGLRRGEICGIETDKIDFEKSIFPVKKTRTQAGNKYIVKKPKTIESERYLSFNEEVRIVILEYLKQQQKNKEIFQGEYFDSPFLMVDKRGVPVRPNYISDLWKKFLEKNNLRHIRFHDLRHTFISIAYQSNLKTLEIMKATGHSSPRMLEKVYAHVQETAAIDVVNTVSRVLSK